jgi:hypothetical protein
LAAETGSALIIIDHSGWGKSHAGGTIHKLGRAAESLQVVKREGKQEDEFTAWQVLDVTGQDANYRVMMPGGPPLVSLRYDSLHPAIRPEDKASMSVLSFSVASPPAPRESWHCPRGRRSRSTHDSSQREPRRSPKPDNKREVRHPGGRRRLPRMVGRPGHGHYRLATRDYGS